MTERTPGGGDEAMDLEILARDDVLLDALGRGEEPPAEDDLAAMLAAWHADVADGAPEPTVVRDPAPVAADTAVDAPVTLGSAARRRRLRSRPWALRLAAAVVAVAALTAGLGIGSRTAGPASPLWSLTKLLYPQQAEVRVIEEMIAQARAALTAGRLDDAQHLVDEARGELSRIDDPGTRDRLRAQLDALAGQLAAARAAAMPPATPPAAPAVPSTGPTPRPATGTSAPAPQPSPPQSPAEPSSSPTGESSPLLPLPPLPLPTSSPSLLPSLPGLPLPSGGLLG